MDDASHASRSSAAPNRARALERVWRAGGAVLARYADWLGGLSWPRFVVLALLALIGAGILSELPPFSLPWGAERSVVRPPRVQVDADGDAAERDYEIDIDDKGVRIRPREPAAAPPAASGVPLPPLPPLPSVDIKLPPGAVSDEVREAIEEAKREVREALNDRQPSVTVLPGFRLGDLLPQALALLIVASILVKVMGAGRRKAEARAAEATGIAEDETLKRQVVEARMAAMQAQVEPHFLFNTLASIDHLIETDPRRASRMQKNLIALLRASMPTMRETAAEGSPRHLGRELAVVRPYLEILRMRMEDRLATEICVPDGLLSADFPPMIMQGLVENAIKHGLEPKPEGGKLSVCAEIVHGKLQVSVSDTGLGFGKAKTAGSGIGLANIRERLRLLYGAKATLAITENRPTGSVVTVTVPYVAHTKDDKP